MKVIIEQKTGIYAIFDTVVDNIIHVDLSYKELYHIMHKDLSDSLKRNIKRQIKCRKLEGDKGEYSLTNTLEWIKEVHGVDEYERIKNAIKEK